MNLDQIIALQRAHAPAQARTSLSYRLQKLDELRRALQGPWQEKLANALHEDFGKSLVEVGLTEIFPTLDNLKIIRKNLKRWSAPQKVKTPLFLFGSSSYTQPEPKGNTLVIAPWNYPIFLSLHPLCSSYAAGNTVILKPSEHTPKTSAALAALVSEFFEPEEVTVVTGGVEVSTALLNERFDHIFFTGGGPIGRKVLAGAAANLTPVTLELGGKSPALVLQGANLGVSARRLIWGKGINAGQTCIAPDHLLVESDLYADLLNALRNERLAMYGDNPLASDQLGKIINEQQFQRLERLLETARANGRILIGGEISREQRRIAPTVIAVDDRQDPLMGEELFGPLLPVLRLGNLSEALQTIRQQGKPLALYLFGGSEAQQQEVLSTTSSGGVCLNDVVMQAGIPELPFGGVGASGMGSYHGHNGFQTFSHYKAVLKRGFRFDFKLRYPPYSVDLNVLRRIAG